MELAQPSFREFNYALIGTLYLRRQKKGRFSNDPALMLSTVKDVCRAYPNVSLTQTQVSRVYEWLWTEANESHHIFVNTKFADYKDALAEIKTLLQSKKRDR